MMPNFVPETARALPWKLRGFCLGNYVVFALDIARRKEIITAFVQGCLPAVFRAPRPETMLNRVGKTVFRIFNTSGKGLYMQGENL